MPNKGKSGHSGLPIALISRLPDWVVQSVLPIAIHRLLHRFYPLARVTDDTEILADKGLNGNQIPSHYGSGYMVDHSYSAMKYLADMVGCMVGGPGGPNKWVRDISTPDGVS